MRPLSEPRETRKSGIPLAAIAPFAVWSVAISCFLPAFAPICWGAEGPPAVGEIIHDMEAAYEKVEDYRTEVEVRDFTPGGPSKTERFLYSFKKPDSIRLDFEAPHAGTTMIYPDPSGKVVVRLGGIAHLFTFHLSPGSRLLADPSGQRIDQTDLGLLIENICRSLTHESRGPVTIAEEEKVIRIRVLAKDHFLPGVTTLYSFLIDGKIWLPQGVEEATPDNQLKRVVLFRDLRTNVGIPDAFFGNGRTRGTGR